MTDIEQKKIFSKNLNYYLSKANQTQREVADAISVSPQTFNTWCQGIALPRMGKVQRLADYFHIEKSDLIDERTEQPSSPKSNIVKILGRVATGKPSQILWTKKRFQKNWHGPVNSSDSGSAVILWSRIFIMETR